jgi:hypothetical protein
MRENIANGEIPFRKAHLRSVIDRIGVDDHVVRVIGDTATLDKSWSAKAYLRPGFSVWYAVARRRE